MSKIKRIIAVLLAMCFVVALASCRTKDEVALKYSDGENTCELTSAMYLCHLIDADMEFKNKVYEELSKDKNADLANIDYTKQSYEDKDYTTWIKDYALKACSKYAYNATKFDALKLKLDENQITYLDYYSDYYWNQQGYRDTYEKNGVSFKTYKEFFENTYKSQAVYDYYYGEKSKEDKDRGSLRPDDSQIKKSLGENYVLADAITYKFTDDNGTTVTDDAKAATLTKLKAYAERLNKGEAFSKIYIEYYGKDKTDTVGTEGAKAAKDKYAEVFGGDKTQSPSEAFSKINKLKTGEAMVVELSDQYILALKQDIYADSYYLNSYDESVVRILKGDEFDKTIEDEGAKLSVTKNESALKYYSPKKLEYPTAAAATSAAAAY